MPFWMLLKASAFREPVGRAPCPLAASALGASAAPCVTSGIMASGFLRQAYVSLLTFITSKPLSLMATSIVSLSLVSWAWEGARKAQLQLMFPVFKYMQAVESSFSFSTTLTPCWRAAFQTLSSCSPCWPLP